MFQSVSLFNSSYPLPVLFFLLNCTYALNHSSSACDKINQRWHSQMWNVSGAKYLYNPISMWRIPLRCQHRKKNFLFVSFTNIDGQNYKLSLLLKKFKIEFLLISFWTAQTLSFSTLNLKAMMSSDVESTVKSSASVICGVYRMPIKTLMVFLMETPSSFSRIDTYFLHIFSYSRFLHVDSESHNVIWLKLSCCLYRLPPKFWTFYFVNPK